MEIIKKVFKGVVIWVVKIIKNAVGAILVNELKAYWKKHREKLLKKFIISRLFKKTKEKMATTWQRMRSFGKKKEKPKAETGPPPKETPTPKTPKKPDPPKSKLVSEEDPTVTEFAGMVYGAAKSGTSRLYNRGIDFLRGGKKKAEKPSQQPETKKPDKPKDGVPPQKSTAPKKSAGPKKPGEPEPPEETPAEFSRRLQREYGRKRDGKSEGSDENN